MISSIVQTFLIKIQPYVSEQENKRQRIYDLLNAETKPNQTKKKKKKNLSEIIGVSLWPKSSPILNPLDYVMWDVLQNKTNAISHSNISSITIAIEAEWNKISEFILKVCISYRRRVDAIIQVNGSRIG